MRLPVNYDFFTGVWALQEPVSTEMLETGLKTKKRGLKTKILLGFNPIPNPKSLRYVWMSFRKASRLLDRDANQASKGV